MPVGLLRTRGRARRLLLLLCLIAVVGIASCSRQQVTVHGAGTQVVRQRSPEVVTLAADAWPPYNNDVNDENEGFLVDLARAALEPHGYEVRYVVVPWERALHGARTGLFDGAIAPSHEEGIGLIFPETVLFRSRASFFVLAESSWEYESNESLADVALGSIQGYDYGEVLNRYVEVHEDDQRRVQAIAGESALPDNIRKLLSGRVNVIVDNFNTVIYTARSMGVEDRIRPAGIAPGGSDCYIAFSPFHPRAKELAALLDAEVKAMREDGRLAKIMEPYGELNLHQDADEDASP